MRDGNRTEQATPKRILNAREDGNVPQCADLSRALVLLASFGLLMTMGARAFSAFFQYCHGLWSEGFALSSEPGALLAQVARPFYCFLSFFIAVGIAALAIPAIVAIVFRGWIFLPSKVAPDLSRLALKGLVRCFSLDSTYRMVSGLVKAVVCVAAVWMFWRGRGERAMAAVHSAPEQIVPLVRGFAVPVAAGLLAGFLLLGALDLFYQRWKYYRDLRMTPEEVRREAREEQAGTPELQSRRIEMLNGVSRHDAPPKHPSQSGEGKGNSEKSILSE